MLCALVTTVRSHHISLRPVQGGWSQLIASGSQFIVYVLLCFSFWKYREIQAGSVDADLANVWMIGLGLLSTVVFIQAIKSLRDLGTFSPTSWRFLFFCVMGLASGVYFILIKDYPSGLAAKLGLISVNAKLYLQVGLYVWIGMLLKQSMLTQKVFDVVRPLKLAPSYSQLWLFWARRYRQHTLVHRASLSSLQALLSTKSSKALGRMRISLWRQRR